MLSRPRSAPSQRGFSLLELLVSLAPSLLVTAISAQLLVASFGSGHASLRQVRLAQDLRSVLNTLVHDLQRAGSWGLAEQAAQLALETDLKFSACSGRCAVQALQPGSDEGREAFIAPLDASTLGGLSLILNLHDADTGVRRYEARIIAVDAAQLQIELPSGVQLPEQRVRAGQWTILNPFAPIEASGSCLRYRYDLDLDGIVDEDEQFGFRYDATHHALEASTTATTCADDGWQDVTDPRLLDLTAFTVIAGAQTHRRRSVDIGAREYLIKIDGRLQAAGATSRSVQAAVQVRNAVSG